MQILLTCLYSSRVMVPSLSVSCMLNKTAETNAVNRGLVCVCVFFFHLFVFFFYLILGRSHLSFSLRMCSRCSSLMLSDGGLKWDMTTRNSSKPISSTVPSPFWWKFLGRTDRSEASADIFIQPHDGPPRETERSSDLSTSCRRRPL